MRGYFGIGVYGIKNEINIGTLWRSAFIMGASFIFTVGRRYKKQSSDTVSAFRHIPLFHFLTMDEFIVHVPHDCQIVCIENNPGAIPLSQFSHPERALYLLGAEDTGLPKAVLEKYKSVIIESEKRFSLNVATAGSIIAYDRYSKRSKES